MAEPDQKLCFVIGPIGNEGSETRRKADWLLKGIIKPVFTDHFRDFKVERADNIPAPESISSQIITRLMDAKLVITDMSEDNPNTFYELGIRHMLPFPTIHMIRKDSPIPFDVASFRAIYFSTDTHDEYEHAKAQLKEAVEEVIRPGFNVENPVTHARGVAEIQKHASPEVRVLTDELAALRSKVEGLERTTTTLTNTLIHSTATGQFYRATVGLGIPQAGTA